MAEPSLFNFNATADPNDPAGYSAMVMRQKIAAQLAAQEQRKGYPKNFGEGLTAIGDALASRGQMNTLDRLIRAQSAMAAKSGAAAYGTPTPGPQASADDGADTPVVNIAGDVTDNAAPVQTADAAPAASQAAPALPSWGGGAVAANDLYRPTAPAEDDGGYTYPATAMANTGTVSDAPNVGIRNTIAARPASSLFPAPGVPQPNPPQAGQDAPPSAAPSATIPPSTLAALQAGSPAEAAGNRPIVTDIQPAPAPQVAQAQLPPPGFIMEKPTPPVPPMKDTSINPRERNALHYLNGDYDPITKANAQRALQEEADKKAAAYDFALKNFEVQKEIHKARDAKYQEQMESAAKRAQEYQKAGQGVLTPGATAPQGAVPPERLLGTPQSPQRTGIPTPPPVPPNTSPEEWSKLHAPLMSKAIEAVNTATPQFDEAIKTLRLAREHPGKQWGVGATSEFAKRFPGTAAYDFGTVMEQIGGKNFLSAYQQLKGGGQITEIEGTKAEAAQARLKTAQTKESFDAALNDFESALRQDLEIAQRKVNRPVTAWRLPGDNASYAPDIGQRRGDKEYIGGSPSDPMSWRRVQ